MSQVAEVVRPQVLVAVPAGGAPLEESSRALALEGFEIEVARGAEDALERLRDLVPDLLVLGPGLPEEPGAGTLREAARVAGVPCLEPLPEEPTAGLAARARAAILANGARRLDEWTRLVARLPPLDAVVEVDAVALAERLAALPDDANTFVRLADGKRSVREIIDASRKSEVTAAALLGRLHADGVLRVAGSAGTRVEGTPEPDGVDWFADPASARAGVRPPGPMGVGRPVTRAPRPHRRAPLGIVAAVVALALAILVAPEWARRRGGVARPRPAVAEPAWPAADPPPALAITEPAPRVVRLPPSEPAPALAPDVPAVTSGAEAPAPPRAGDRAGAPRAGRPGSGRTAAARPAHPPGYEEAMGEGRSRLRAGDADGAAVAFRRAIDLQDTSESQTGLGQALSEGRRPDEALAPLRRATALDGGNAAAWLALGEVHLVRGETAEARSAYQRYLSLEPSGKYAPEVRQVLARLRP